ncbi:MAG TPA: ribosomal protein L13e, partial [Nitrososphaeraceae archaeon]|nr:ribosomal protein L13e [Nitrososphaeraceae archaeon]
IVKKQRRGRELIRNGRGYSKGELKQAGFGNIDLARIHGIQVDVLRKTSHPENIGQLKPIAKKLETREKSKKVQERPKKETKQQK